MYEKFGVSVTAKGVDCEVDEWLEHNTLRRFGMGDSEFVKRMYEDKVKVWGVRGRLAVKWINRMQEYWR